MEKPSSRQILAKNIARLMDEVAGLDTQEAVAKRAGMGQSTVSRLLLLEQGATVDMLDALARAFGVLPFELLTDSEQVRHIAYSRMILGPRVSDARAAEHLPPAPSYEEPVRKPPLKRAAPKRRRKNPPAT